tara:strand:+ start:9914 stop:11134 length:1221 start_codon:yes stop_codon:yes gene_type:complete
MISIKDFFYYFIKFQLIILLFVPKIYVSNLIGIESNLKPEDIFWILSLPFVFLFFSLRKEKFFLAWILFLTTIFIGCIIHYHNLLIFGRLFLYSIPLIFLHVGLESKNEKSILKILKFFLFFSFIYSLLLTFFPLPFFHTGEFLLGPVERYSANFGNGVEAALSIFLVTCILKIKNELKLSYYILALVTILLTGSRLVIAVYLIFGLYNFMTFKKRYIFTISGIFIFIFVNLSLTESIEKSRFSTVNKDLIDNLISVYKQNISPINYPINDDGSGYCFNFNDSLSDDQSFAMRLSKASFVLNSVVFGSHKFGFGFGKCIGGAADNLFIRFLNDGGLLYFFGFCIWIVFLILNLRNSRLFILSFILLSFFYDTIYFSRVAPIFFLFLYFTIKQSKLENDFSKHSLIS